MAEEEVAIVSESPLDNDVRETESTETEDKCLQRIILSVFRRVFSIELVALMCSFSSGLHTVIRWSVSVSRN